MSVTEEAHSPRVSLGLRSDLTLPRYSDAQGIQYDGEIMLSPIY